MIRFITAASTVVGFLIFSMGLLWRQKKIGRYDQNRMEQESAALIRKVFHSVLKTSGVTITVKGKENIPGEGAALYVGNHRSYFDILVGYTAISGLLGFVAKKEMKRYPLLSDWMVNLNCLFLDRKDLKEGLKTILEGIEKVKRGVSIWIFPEGTRNKNEDALDLLPFKEGSLKIAEKSGCPVIPVAITGTADIFEKHLPFIRPSHVTIEFGTPIIIKDLSPEDRKFAGAYVRKTIIGMLEREQDGFTGNQKAVGSD